MIDEQKLNCVAGTMSIEGMVISDETKDTLNKYADGELTDEQIVSEWKEKHKNYPKDKFIEQTKSDWKFACDLAQGFICPYVTSDGPLCYYDKCDLEEKN